MTYEKLGELIAQMTTEQRAKPALIPDKNTGETSEIDELLSLESFNGQEDADQLIMWYSE